MIAPIAHRLPPRGYGPWEQVVSDLTTGLVTGGHDVTLFAPASTVTNADLVATVPDAFADWPLDEMPPDARVWEEVHIARAMETVTRGEFDIVHSHLNVHPLGYARHLDTPIVTTLHGSAWNRSIHPALEMFSDLPFVSLSESERSFFPGLNYVATVPNGIDCDAIRFSPDDGDSLLFVGRMAPEKQPHLAIEVARKAGRTLVLAGPVEAKHRDYFDEQVSPGIDDRDVVYLGPLDRAEVLSLYPTGLALLMPLAWEEPFGLVVVEALASGTPVIAWRRGAMPELIRDGVTGALVDDVDGAVSALENTAWIDRMACRHDAETRFSVDAMTGGYVSAYELALTG
jgi:glycosyltransferase involved in cell wall biosynthesis